MSRFSTSQTYYIPRTLTPGVRAGEAVVARWKTEINRDLRELLTQRANRNATPDEKKERLFMASPSLEALMFLYERLKSKNEPSTESKDSESQTGNAQTLENP